MTNKEYDIKTYLQSIRAMRNNIEYELEKLESMRELATSVSKRVDKVKVQSSKRTDNFERVVIKIVTYENKIKNKVDKYLKLIDEGEALLNRLKKEKHRKVMKERYICNMKFEEIAVKNNYDISWVYKVHKESIQELAKINVE